MMDSISTSEDLSVNTSLWEARKKKKKGIPFSQRCYPVGPMYRSIEEFIKSGETNSDADQSAVAGSGAQFGNKNQSNNNEQICWSGSEFSSATDTTPAMNSNNNNSINTPVNNPNELEHGQIWTETPSPPLLHGSSQTFSINSAANTDDFFPEQQHSSIQGSANSNRQESIFGAEQTSQKNTILNSSSANPFSSNNRLVQNQNIPREPMSWEEEQSSQRTRSGSQTSLQTALSGTSSSTVVSDPHVSQYVERHENRHNNIMRAFEEDSNSIIGLESLNSFPTEFSVNTNQLTLAVPPSESTTAHDSTLTGSTLQQAIQIPLFSEPLDLFKDRNALRDLAQKMGVQFEVRETEGAFIFAQQSSRRTLIFHPEVHGQAQTQNFVEGIRVSLHSNGRLLREGHLWPMEKWLAIATVEGVCARFFSSE